MKSQFLGALGDSVAKMANGGNVPVAEALGPFKKQGLDVKVNWTRSGADVMLRAFRPELPCRLAAAGSLPKTTS